MNLGEKLRQLRQEENRTQPELAEAMGIEQSYLSKLENGKSLPSNDVFKRILDVFNLDVGDFVDDLGPGARNRLRQIPDVADYLHGQKQQIIGNRRRWLLGSSVLLALGVALIYSGADQLVLSDSVYQYISYGIVRAGESKELYKVAVIQPLPPLGNQGKWGQIEGRLDEDFLSTRKFRGVLFNVAVPGGSRTYRLKHSEQVAAWQNKAVIFIGILMTAMGGMGVFLERKLSLYQ